MKKTILLMLITVFIFSVTLIVGAEEIDKDVTINVDQNVEISGLGSSVEWETEPDFLGKWGHDYFEFFREDFTIEYNTPVTFTMSSDGFDGEHYDLDNIISYGLRDKSGEISDNPYVHIVSTNAGGSDSIDLDRLSSGNSGRQNMQLVGTWNRSSEDWVNIISDEYKDTITVTVSAN